MKIEIIGTVASLGDEKTRGPFRSRELLLAEGGDSARLLPVEFGASEGHDFPLGLLALGAGDLVKVEAVLSGREWQGRYFLSLRGIAVRRASFEDPSGALPPASPPPAPSAEPLPF